MRDRHFNGPIYGLTPTPPFLVAIPQERASTIAWPVSRWKEVIEAMGEPLSLKRVSNLWLQEQGPDYADFQWQGGYADFSVSQSRLAEVKQYIAGQEEHHRKRSFQDELRALLRRHELEWDEQYVWD